MDAPTDPDDDSLGIVAKRRRGSESERPAPSRPLSSLMDLTIMAILPWVTRDHFKLLPEDLRELLQRCMDKEQQIALFDEYKSYHVNGQLEEHEHYVNGELHGEYKDYFDNGRLGIHAHYVKNKLHGEYKDYFENGQLGIHKYYVNGELQGEYKDYYSSGQLHLHEHYENGKLHGESKAYYRNGQLLEHTHYVNGAVKR